MCTVRVPICVPPVPVHVTLAAPASIHKSAHVRECECSCSCCCVDLAVGRGRQRSLTYFKM